MSHVGKKFKLKSGSGGVFTVVKEYGGGHHVPLLVGRNERHNTTVSVVDVIFTQ